MKRIFDILISFAVLVAIAPLLLLIFLLVYLGDSSSLIFKQRRVGYKCKTFWLYKFRSMVVNAERLGGYSTAQGDARITKIGRFIRRTSLDELPQLFNVLKGEMSLVGPRPHVPEQRALYTAQEWQLRHSVRPGITGLAQATLRSKATVEQVKKMDLFYVQNVSFCFDIKIILMTFVQLFKNSGN